MIMSPGSSYGLLPSSRLALALPGVGLVVEHLRPRLPAWVLIRGMRLREHAHRIPERVAGRRTDLGGDRLERCADLVLVPILGDVAEIGLHHIAAHILDGLAVLLVAVAENCLRLAERVGAELDLRVEQRRIGRVLELLL